MGGAKVVLSPIFSVKSNSMGKACCEPHTGAFTMTDVSMGDMEKMETDLLRLGEEKRRA